MKNDPQEDMDDDRCKKQKIHLKCSEKGYEEFSSPFCTLGAGLFAVYFYKT